MRIKTRILPEGSGYFDKVQYGSGMVTKEPSDKLIGQRRSAEIRAEYITELFAFQLGDKNKDGSFSVLGHKRIFFRIGSEGKKFEIKISDLDDSKSLCHLKILDGKGSELPNLPKSLPVLRRVGENLVRIDALYTWLEQRGLSLT